MARDSTTGVRGSPAGRLLRVGVVVNNVGGYSRGVLRGVFSYGVARAWECRVEGVNESHITSKLAEFDGLIVQAATPEQARLLQRRSIPAVNVSSALGLSAVPSVVSDDRAVGRLAADYFLRRGYRSLAFYASDERQFVKLRQEGFRSQIEGAGLVPHVISPIEDLLRSLESLERPLALMACNDRAALAVLDVARRAGIRVPDDVAVLGVDDDELMQSLADPPLSSINTARERIGFEAAAMLDRLMTGETTDHDLVELAPRGVVERRSTDALAVADPMVSQALRFIQLHAGRRIGVNDIAQHVLVSRRQLERRFRALLARSVLEELTRIRLDRARRLLIETQLTLPQIALACGFASASYFSVAFSKAHAQSPGRFREALNTR